MNNNDSNKSITEISTKENTDQKENKTVKCDFADCEKDVCEEDMRYYTPPTKRFCKEHSDMFNNLIIEHNVPELLSLWVKSKRDHSNDI